MHPLRLTLWGDFAEVEGTYIQQHLTDENILLASRVTLDIMKVALRPQNSLISIILIVYLSNMFSLLQYNCRSISFDFAC